MPHPHDRFVDLAHSFPVLRPYLAAAGITTGASWDPLRLDHEVSRGAGTGATQAAALILALWNGDYAWEVGPFVIARALSNWDKHQRDAFIAWAKDPWLP